MSCIVPFSSILTIRVCAVLLLSHLDFVILSVWLRLDLDLDLLILKFNTPGVLFRIE